MSPEAESVLAEHNQEAVDSLVAYISHYVLAHLDSLPPANVLPLSGFAYPPTTTAASKSASHLRQQPSAACGVLADVIGHPSSMSESGGALHDFHKECRISSPFAALSGRHVEPQLFSFHFAYFQMLNGGAVGFHAQECSAHMDVWLHACLADVSVLGLSSSAELICQPLHGCCPWHLTARKTALLTVAHEAAIYNTLTIINASGSHDSLTAGHAEHFSSLEEVVQCVRPGILLDAASVPSVRMTDRHGRVLPLNRYILDYWGHGQKQALTLANGLREGEAFRGFYNCG